MPSVGSQVAFFMHQNKLILEVTAPLEQVGRLL